MPVRTDKQHMQQGRISYRPWGQVPRSRKQPDDMLLMPTGHACRACLLPLT